jgi:uncharacterized protein YecE (DUF72 family)
VGHLRVGCAGWAYDEWVGPVYAQVPSNQRLRAYATRFNLVEIDSTFYAVPTPTVVQGWLDQVADVPDFHFTAKLPQAITHEALPAGGLETVESTLDEFLDVVVSTLEDAGRFESVLVQLPPRFRGATAPEKATMLEGLAKLLSRLAADRRHVAVEFRHPSWFGSDGALDAQARDALHSQGAGLVSVDGLGFEPTPTKTAPWSHFRLHGRSSNLRSLGPKGPGVPQKGPYSARELQALASAIRGSLEKDSSTSVILTYHEAGQSARSAVSLLGALGRPVRGLPILPLGTRSLNDFG